MQCITNYKILHDYNVPRVNLPLQCLYYLWLSINCLINLDLIFFITPHVSDVMGVIVGHRVSVCVSVTTLAGKQTVLIFGMEVKWKDI